MKLKGMALQLANVIQLVPTDSLRGYEKNARTHSEEQIAQIARSIEEFGFNNPILVDADRGIIAGHGRLAAAQKLKLAQVPVIQLGHLTPAQKRAFILADNKLALNAGWDAELLQAELSALAEMDFDLDAIGFSDAELDAILEADDPTSVVAPGPAPTLREHFEQAATARADGQPAAAPADPAEDPYTKKIQTPIYEPKGQKPEITELCDAVKTKTLMDRIDAAEIPDEARTFLRLAAQRHTVFNYERIAEYYAHAPKEVQALFEESALVIIDFDKAIENGFVVMTKEIAEAYPSDAAE